MAAIENGATAVIQHRLPITPVPLAVLLVEQNHDEVVVEQVLIVERHREDGFRAANSRRYELRLASADWGIITGLSGI